VSSPADSLIQIVDQLQDQDHRGLLAPLEGRGQAILEVLARLGGYADTLEGSARLLRGMRLCRIQADLYRSLGACGAVGEAPACGLDGEEIIQLKRERALDRLPAAYEARINQLQRLDLRQSLEALGALAPARAMSPQDYGRELVVEAPLRLGISSANASDNHLRTKEQGGKTLNAGIDLQVEGEAAPAPPLRVRVRRRPEKGLWLCSRSTGFEGELALAPGEAVQQERYFAYRRGGDEALRLVKQALVHTGIVREGEGDIAGQIAAYTGGGGLEVETRSKVLQGSGLGTSSILAAAILKALYRLAGHPIATPEGEYPALYDQSLLLEQSVGLNSGWQDARGACGGPSAVKDFCAPPTLGLPDPRVRFIEIDEAQFAARVVLFNTGIARLATRGLNVVLDAYLTRDPARYPAIRESLAIHDQMVAALSTGDYALLGRLASRYWELRCILDPGATSPLIRQLFEAPRLRQHCEGGLLTGAGGGGFALLICREGQAAALKEELGRLRQVPGYEQSGVVEYRLNRTGLRLGERWPCTELSVSTDRCWSL
jgi:galactokinase/mevalonate kinase-like predicted kinase